MALAMVGHTNNTKLIQNKSLKDSEIVYIAFKMIDSVKIPKTVTIAFLRCKGMGNSWSQLSTMTNVRAKVNCSP